MSKNKFVTLLVVLLLLLTLSVGVLGACVKGNTEDPDTPGPGPGPGPGPDPNPDPEGPSFDTSDIFDAIGASTGNGVAFTTIGDVTTPDGTYTLDMRLNYATEEPVNMAFTVTDKKDNSRKVGVYIFKGNLYIDPCNGSPMLHISDIDTDYLISILQKAPDTLLPMLDELLNGLVPGLTVQGIWDLVSLLLFSTSDPDLTQEGIATFDTSVNVNTLLDGIGGLLGSIPGLTLPEDVLNLINSIVDYVPQMNIHIGTSFVFDGEKLGNLTQLTTSVDIQDGLQTSLEAKFETQPVEIEFPAEIESCVDFSLTNLAFDLSLDINTMDMSGKIRTLDVGKIINTVMGQQMLPEGLILLEANASYKLVAAADLNLNYEGAAEDKNYIHLAFVDNATQKELIAADYMNGYFYIRADRIKYAYAFDLNAQIGTLVKTVTDAIDNALGTDFRPSEDAAVVSVSINEAGESVISPTLIDIINSIAGLVGMKDNLKVDGNNITLIVNEGLLGALSGLGVALPQQVTDIVKMLGAGAQLNIALDTNGLKEITLDAVVDNTLNVAIKADNMQFGYVPKMTVTDMVEDQPVERRVPLDEYIRDYAVADPSAYATDFGSLLTNFTKDFSIQGIMEFASANSSVDLAKVINGFLGTEMQLNMPIELELQEGMSKFSYRLDMMMDWENPKNSQFFTEVYSTGSGEVIFGAYVYQDEVYVNLDNILGLGKFRIYNAELVTKLQTMILDALGKLVNPDQSGDGAASAAMSNANIRADQGVGANDPSVITINNAGIQALITSRLIESLINTFAADMGLEFNLVLNAIVDLGMDERGNLRLDGTLLGEEALADISFFIGDTIKQDNGMLIKLGEDGNLNPADFKHNYKADNAVNLLDSIFETLELDLWINWSNVNPTTNSGSFSAKGKETQLRVRSGNVYGLDSQVGVVKVTSTTIVVDLYGDWAGKHYITVAIDLKTGNGGLSLSQALLDDGVGSFLGFFAGLFKSTIEGISIPLGDIWGPLTLAINDLLFKNGDSDVSNGVTEGDMPEEVAPAAEEGALDITSLLSGVRAVFEGGRVVAKVNLNGEAFGEFLGGALGGFGVAYNDVDADVFVNQFYDAVVWPMLEPNLPSAIMGFKNNINDMFKGIIARFIPLPHMKDIQLDVNIVDGVFQSAYLVGVGEDLNQHRLEAYIYNPAASGRVDWKQSSYVQFNKDSYQDATAAGDVLKQIFENRKPTLYNGGRVVTDLYPGAGATPTEASEVKYYLVGTDGEVEITDWKTPFVDQEGQIQVGKYKLRQEATFGSAKYSRTFTLDIVGKQIVSVTDVSGRDEFHINAADFDGSRFTADWLGNTLGGFVRVEYLYYDGEEEKTEFEVIPVNWDVKGTTGVVSVNGGKIENVRMYNDTYQFSYTTTLYVDGIVGLILDGGELADNTIALDIYDYIGNGMPTTALALNADGTTSEVTLTWDKAQMDELIDTVGGTYVVNVVVNQGKVSEGTMQVRVIVENATLQGIAGDTLQADADAYLQAVQSSDDVKSNVIAALPNRLDFVKMSKENVSLPVTYTIGDFTPNLNGEQTVDVVIEVGKPSDAHYFRQETTVVLPALNMQPEADISFNTDEFASAGAAGYFPSVYGFKFGNTRADVQVTWDLSALNPNVAGDYTVYAINRAGTVYEQRIAVTVHVTAPAAASEEV